LSSRLNRSTWPRFGVTTLSRWSAYSRSRTTRPSASQVSAQLGDEADTCVDVATGRERDVAVKLRAPHKYVLAAPTEVYQQLDPDSPADAIQP
jgi:hypothetical protein